MKISISEYDRHNAFRIVLIQIAKYHDIENHDYKTNEELYSEIVAVNSSLLNLLNDYLEAYNKWFEFYQHKKYTEQPDGGEYNLNNTERYELAELMTARQNSLKNLQEEYDRLRRL